MLDFERTSWYIGCVACGAPASGLPTPNKNLQMTRSFRLTGSWLSFAVFLVTLASASFAQTRPLIQDIQVTQNNQAKPSGSPSLIQKTGSVTTAASTNVVRTLFP